MKQQNPALKYGFIGAIVLVATGIIIQLLFLSYLQKAVNNPENSSQGTIILISLFSLVLIAGIFLICIIKSMKDYRKINPDFTYRKLVGQGLVVTLIIVVVSTGCSYLYSHVIAPEAKQKALELTKQLYENLKIPDEQKEKVLEKLNNQDPVRELLTSLGLTLLLGMIISLVSASVLNRKNNLTNPNQLR